MARVSFGGVSVVTYMRPGVERVIVCSGKKPPKSVIRLLNCRHLPTESIVSTELQHYRIA